MAADDPDSRRDRGPLPDRRAAVPPQSAVKLRKPIERRSRDPQSEEAGSTPGMSSTRLSIPESPRGGHHREFAFDWPQRPNRPRSGMRPPSRSGWVEKPRARSPSIRSPTPRCRGFTARIEQNAQGAVLVHLSQSNKTLLNDQPIDQSEPIQVGDRVRLGYTGPTLEVLAIETDRKPDSPALPKAGRLHEAWIQAKRHLSTWYGDRQVLLRCSPRA